ncbi:MAG: spore cortex biosynthesis protein YabQ [Anaeromassilibacillus sp.]|nr:spore cortex biosynthesis protein YabQ [Anaeromassilibacillus sp.]
MEVTIEMEYHCLLWSFVLGAFVYGEYEVFRLIRRIFSNSFISNFVCDILFMTAAGFSVFTFALGFSSGVVRWYTIFACAFSFAVLRMTIGQLTGKLYGFIFKAAVKISTAVKNFFQKFLKILLKNISKMLYNIVKVYRKIFLSKGKR